MSLNKSTSTFNKAFSEAKSQIAFGFFMKFPRAKSTSTLFLHLRSFKTPPSGAVMSDEDDTDCAFSMRKGVKKITKLWLFASLNAFFTKL
jgi:hypothetical protein